MSDAREAVNGIIDASTWDQRITRIRLMPRNHGTAEHARIFAEVAREAYAPHLAADFAHIHEAPFYEQNYFEDFYVDACVATNGFADVSEARLAEVLYKSPRTLLEGLDGPAVDLESPVRSESTRSDGQARAVATPGKPCERVVRSSSAQVPLPAQDSGVVRRAVHASSSDSRACQGYLVRYFEPWCGTCGS